MALDVGDKRIGIAISDDLRLTIQGRPTLRRMALKHDIQAVRRLAQDNEVGEIVVGHPIHMDGTTSPQSEKVKRFADHLRGALGLPIILWDERLTSYAAEEHLRQKGLSWRERKSEIDKYSAIMILQSYLDESAKAQ